MKASVDLTNFTAGELSPRMKARDDVAKYYNGLDTMLNAVTMPQGGATRRPATMMVANVGDQTRAARLIDFVFSTVQPYVLELGELYARFYANDGQIVSGLPATPVQIATPWHASETAAIEYVQSDDVLFVCHPTYPTQEISRTGNTAWSIAPLAFRDGPYLPVNATATTLSVSGTNGSVTVTASSTAQINNGQGFLASDLGRHIRLNLQALWGWLIITAVGSTTHVTASVQPSNPNGAYGLDGQPWTASTIVPTGAVMLNGANYYVAAVGGTTASSGGPTGTTTGIKDGTVTWNYQAAAPPTSSINWALGKWCGTTGYPYCPTFWQGRLALCGTNNAPNALELSVTGDFPNFAPTQADGTVSDLNALSWVIDDDEVNAIRWLSPAGSAQAMQLGVGTSGGEQIMQAATTAQALTPSSVQAYRETALGSAPNVRPQRILKSVLFFNRPGRKLHEWTFQWQVNGYLGPDLSVLAEHITRSGVVQMAYQQSPYGIIWMIRADGTLIGLTYLREQDIVAWHRHQLGGQYYGGPPIVESLAVIPSPDGSYDELWLEVLRTVNGTPVRFVEVMGRFFDAMPADQGQFLDAGVSSTLATPAANLTPSGFASTAALFGAAPSFGAVGTLTAGAAVFSAGSVGQVVRVNGGRLVITGYTDAEHVAAQALAPMTSLAPAASGAWSMMPLSTSFSGVSHLNGEAVGILGDGQNFGTQVAAGGGVTLAAPGASLAMVGLPYPSVLVTMPAAPQRAAQAGVEGRVKRIDHLFLRLQETIGGAAGMRTTDPMTGAVNDSLEPIQSRNAGAAMNQGPALFTGIRKLDARGPHDREQQMIIVQTEPLPLTVLAISAAIDLEELAQA